MRSQFQQTIDEIRAVEARGIDRMFDDSPQLTRAEIDLIEEHERNAVEYGIDVLANDVRRLLAHARSETVRADDAERRFEDAVQDE